MSSVSGQEKPLDRKVESHAWIRNWEVERGHRWQKIDELAGSPQEKATCSHMKHNQTKTEYFWRIKASSCSGHWLLDAWFQGPVGSGPFCKTEWRIILTFYFHPHQPTLRQQVLSDFPAMPTLWIWHVYTFTLSLVSFSSFRFIPSTTLLHTPSLCVHRYTSTSVPDTWNYPSSPFGWLIHTSVNNSLSNHRSWWLYHKSDTLIIPAF